MKNSSGEPIDLAIIVQKQSQTGIFKNERLLLIKSGFISYFSNIPKFYIGNVRSIELSGELPKMTLSAAQVESIERKRKYIHMKFNKKHLINLEKFKGLVEGANGKDKGNKMADEVEEWIFKCANVNQAETFIKQIQFYKNDPSRKPEISKAIDGYKDGKKGFRPDSMRLPPSMQSIPNRYSEQHAINNIIARTNAMSFDEKKIQNKQQNLIKQFQNPILQKSEQDEQQKEQAKIQKEQIKNEKQEIKIEQKKDTLKVIQDQNDAPFILPCKTEQVVNTYSKQTFPYYPFVKPKKSSKKEELKQLFLKQTRISEKKLLEKLSSNKVKPNDKKGQQKNIPMKSKNRLQKRSNTLEQFRKAPQVKRVQEKQEKLEKQENKNLQDDKLNSSWSKLKRLKRSYSLIEEALKKSSNKQQNEDQQITQTPLQTKLQMKLQVQKKVQQRDPKNELPIKKQEHVEKQQQKVKQNEERNPKIEEQKKKQIMNMQIEEQDQSNFIKSEESVLEIARMLQNMTKLDQTNISYELGNNLEHQQFFTPQQKQEIFKYPTGKDNKNDKLQKQQEKIKILHLQKSLKEDLQNLEKISQQKQRKDKQKQLTEKQYKEPEIKQIKNQIVQEQKQKIPQQLSIQITKKKEEPKPVMNNQQSIKEKIESLKTQPTLKSIEEKKKEQENKNLQNTKTKILSEGSDVKNIEKVKNSQIIVNLQIIQTKNQEKAASLTLQEPKINVQEHIKKQDKVEQIDNRRESWQGDLKSIKEEEAKDQQSIQINLITDTKQQQNMNIDLNIKDDDAISFKDLKISQQKTVPLLTPRFLQNFGQIEFATPAKPKKIKARKQKQIDDKYFVTIDKKWMLDKKRISIQEQQLRIQCKQYIEQLLTKTPGSEPQKQLQKQCQILLSQFLPKLPTSLCYHISKLKRQRMVKNKAIEIMRQQIDTKQLNEGYNNFSINILFGVRKKWNNWCLYIYDDQERYENVLQNYQMLRKWIEQFEIQELCSVPAMYKLQYKGNFGIFIETPDQQIRNKIPENVEEILTKKIGLSLQQCRSHVLFLQSVQTFNSMIIWINPDYLQSFKINDTCNVNRRMSWINTMNNTISESKVSDIKKLVQCAWEQYLNSSPLTQLETQTQKLQIMKILLDTQNLSVQITTNDQISVYHDCKIEQFQASSNSLIDELLKSKNNSNFLECRRLSLKSIKLLIENDGPSQVKITELIQFLSELGEAYYNKEDYENCYQVIRYFFKLVLRQNVFQSFPFSFGSLEHTKFTLIEHLCQNKQIYLFYCSFMNALVLLFKILNQITGENSKQNRIEMKQIYQCMNELMKQVTTHANRSKLTPQNIKQLVQQINYNQILIHEIFLRNNCESEEQNYLSKSYQKQRSIAEKILQQCTYFNKITLSAFRVVLKVIDAQLEAQAYSEAEKLAQENISRLRNIKNSQLEGNDILLEFFCRRDICKLLKSDFETVSFELMRTHLEFYLQKLRTQSQNEESQLKNGIISMIKKLVCYICEFLAYNDYSISCSLLKVVKNYITNQQTVNKLVQQGLNRLQPYIKKRLQVKQLI